MDEKSKATIERMLLEEQYPCVNYIVNDRNYMWF